MRKSKNNSPNKIGQVIFLLFVIIISVGGLFIWKLGLLEKNWDGKTSFNISVIDKNKKIFIWSYNPTKQQSYILRIPSDLYLETINEKGKVRAGKLFELGQLDKKGGELVRFTLQKELGLIIDGYYCEETNLTDLSMPDLYSHFLLKFTKKNEEINLTGLTDLVLADGEKVFTLTYDDTDKFIRKYFYDQILGEDRAKVIILNATGKEGVGGKLARIINNVGLNVAYIGNKETFLSKSKILAPEKSSTVKKLLQVMRLKEFEVNKESPDITIEIGTGYLPYQ